MSTPSRWQSACSTISAGSALLGASADKLRHEGLTDPTITALKIAEATALRLLEARIEGQPILSSWDALCDYLQAAMAHKRVEEVRILFLNAKNMLFANEALWQGSVDEASVDVREVIARAIALERPPSSSCTITPAAIRLLRSRTSA